METIREILRRHEGYSAKPYKCSGGKITIGIGRNLTDMGLSPSEIDLLFENDIKEAERTASIFAAGAWRVMSMARRNSLISMAFNLGAAKLFGFRRLWEALRRQDFAGAADEMLDSKWAREDVPERAHELADLMRKG